MPTYKRFYPAPSASKAVKKDALKANDILDEIEQEEEYFYQGPEWLDEFIEYESKDKWDDRDEKRFLKQLETLKVLITKLKLAGVGTEEVLCLIL